uniref:Spectrin beta chain, non-erythrocytic 1 (Fragments) n=1 Tax=Capra hircus TaxID=9925 RepID=SPTB2_CAPHI|nr:RecName: Full=Spectrin beta chain, non-erythrocytic 1 [Capra hircus]
VLLLSQDYGKYKEVAELTRTQILAASYELHK